MKRVLIVVSILLLVFSASVFAEESVLIDFSQVVADYPADDPVDNSRTMMDFGVVAGSSYTEEDKAKMLTSLAPGKWEVELASSSSTVTNQRLSMTKEAYVKDDANKYAGEGILAVRVHFPEEPFNSWALVEPPFEIPAYMDMTEINDEGELVTPQDEVGEGRKFDSFGVVKNVGVIKSMSVTVYGLNFPHGFSVVLQDQNNREQQVFMRHLNFDGWRTLTWNNPNYITEVRNRELKRYPLYPTSAPFVKLNGFMFNKDATQIGGDFITYIKEVNLTYDKAVLSLERDIDDEQVWGILQEREQARRNAELKRLGDLQVLRYLERQKMHTEGQGAGGTAEEGGEE
ncbi:MAG: flagellar filament outer layer protein FlaA [Spirochaetales bacterium]|nr:flagellar filament outer layer protein FlaA [Spirochaetales bacterium]